VAKLQVGDTAPDFSLIDEKGNSVRLSDFRGKQPIVLIFYPADETPGCTRQLCAARDSKEVYNQAGVAVFGVNPGSENSHEKFINKHNLTMPLLVDRGLETAAKYDAVMGFGPLKFVNRTVVTVDKTGKIVFYKRGIPSTQEILAPLPKQVNA
jgi:thioredoxin-dependent peroxiredoxin